MIFGSDFQIRRVVTGHDEQGRPVFVSDGVPPRTVTSEAGHGLSELLWFTTPPATTSDGSDAVPELVGRFPENGASTCRLIRFPGFPPGTPVDDTWLRVPGDDPAHPGLHRSETLDLMIVIEGNITLGLDDGDYALGPGDAVVQRGTVHRWRVVGETPCTFLSILMSPDPNADASRIVDAVRVPERGGWDSGATPRRLVTTTFPNGRSGVSPIGPPPALVDVPGLTGVAIHDFWQTGGPLTGVEQGGDVGWTLEPAGAGVAFRRVAFGPDHEAGVGGLHTTQTIDIDVVLYGEIELTLPTGPDHADASVTVLRPGDVVVQRGTAHKWRPFGGKPAAMASVMFGFTPASG
jgi:mannose-6-phosphate isomerase-like protein (cupin superfamily)